MAIFLICAGASSGNMSLKVKIYPRRPAIAMKASRTTHSEASSERTIQKAKPGFFDRPGTCRAPKRSCGMWKRAHGRFRSWHQRGTSMSGKLARADTISRRSCGIWRTVPYRTMGGGAACAEDDRTELTRKGVVPMPRQTLLRRAGSAASASLSPIGKYEKSSGRAAGWVIINGSQTIHTVVLSATFSRC